MIYMYIKNGIRVFWKKSSYEMRLQDCTRRLTDWTIPYLSADRPLQKGTRWLWS